MRPPSILSPVLAAFTATLLTGCALGPPAAPIPNESRRVPANDRRELSLMSCTGELSATQIALAEANHVVAHALSIAGELQIENARLALASTRPRAPAIASTLATAPPPASQIFVVFHRPNSATVELAPDEAVTLLQAARTAERIEIRGRTDGSIETPAESRVARLRAVQMQDWLVRAGVSAARISATWQPVGDHLEPNDTPQGRAVNRRVEVEVYAVAPVLNLPGRTPRAPSGGPSAALQPEPPDA